MPIAASAHFGGSTENLLAVLFVRVLRECVVSESAPVLDEGIRGAISYAEEDALDLYQCGVLSLT